MRIGSLTLTAIIIASVGFGMVPTATAETMKYPNVAAGIEKAGDQRTRAVNRHRRSYRYGRRYHGFGYRPYGYGYRPYRHYRSKPYYRYRSRHYPRGFYGRYGYGYGHYDRYGGRVFADD